MNATSTRTTLVREHSLTKDIPFHTAKATFIDGTEKTYTFHEKETTDNTIELRTHDTQDIDAAKTKFVRMPIEVNGKRYTETIPSPPDITPQSTAEVITVSLHTCKDFKLVETETDTLTHDNWSAEVDMPEEAAVAYQQKIGEDKTRIERYG